MSAPRKWVRCPNKRCENGAVFDRNLLRFVSCERCGGHGAVERKPGFFDAMRWTDMLYPALCILVMVVAWMVLT